MRPELIVAEKEFRDHLTSRRFMAIFVILLLLCTFGLVKGMSDYNETLDSYKKQHQQQQQEPWYQETVRDLQKRIAELEASGASPEELESLKYQLESLTNPPLPSVLTVFGQINQFFMLLGMALGLSMGFDLISKEKEEGSLKSLLSHPVYRDAIINGKAIGALSTLFVVMGATFLITIAIMLFFGVVPNLDDTVRILAYFGMALIYCIVFLGISLMTSTIAKNSAMSVLYALGILMLLIMPSSMAWNIADVIMGPPPEWQNPVRVPVDGGDVVIMESKEMLSSSTGAVAIEPATDQPAKIMPRPDDAYQKYWERKNQIIEAINTISPMSNFERVSWAIINKESGYYGPIMYMEKSYMPYNPNPSIWDTLGARWTNLLAMLLEPFIAFVVSYIVFIRMDVR